MKSKNKKYIIVIIIVLIFVGCITIFTKIITSKKGVKPEVIEKNENNYIPPLDEETDLYLALKEKNIDNLQELMEITEDNNSNQSISYVYNKSFENFKKATVSINNKKVYFNLDKMTFNEEDIPDYDNYLPMNDLVKIVLVKINNYYIYGNSYNHQYNYVIYDENLEEIARSYVSGKIVIANDMIYYEVYESCLEGNRLDGGYGAIENIYSINTINKETSFEFILDRNENIVC